MFIVPDVDRPHDIFRDSKRLPMLRNQLRLSRQGVKQLQMQDQKLGLSKSATKGHTNSKTMKSTNAVGNSSESAEKSTGGNGYNHRPHSAAATVRNRASPTRGAGGMTTMVKNRAISTANTIAANNAEMDMGEYQIPVMIPLLFPRDNVEDGLALEETLSGMSVEDLHVQMKEMRTYITSGLRRKVEEQVLNDLASHETIAYIKALEDEKEHYRKTVIICFRAIAV
jgi:hypothetical protein